MSIQHATSLALLPCCCNVLSLYCVDSSGIMIALATLTAIGTASCIGLSVALLVVLLLRYVCYQ